MPSDPRRPFLQYMEKLPVHGAGQDRTDRGSEGDWSTPPCLCWGAQLTGPATLPTLEALWVSGKVDGLSGPVRLA